MAARKKNKTASRAKSAKSAKASTKSGAARKPTRKAAARAKATKKTAHKSKSAAAKLRPAKKPAPGIAPKDAKKPIGGAKAAPVLAPADVRAVAETKPAVEVKPAATAPVTPKPSVQAATAKPAAAPAAQKPAAAPQPATTVAAEARPVAPAPKPSKPAPPPRPSFKLHEHVVYPAHGVGQIIGIEEQEVAGFRLELFVINFPKEKLTLRVPLTKVAGIGMRRLSDPETAKAALDLLTGRARIKRTMWSRRAQEYEAKINSGDIRSIAEVVRDLYRSEAQPEQSYSERQLYEAALDRLVREIAAVQHIEEIDAIKLVESQLQKNARRGAKAETPEPTAAGEPTTAGDGEIEEAA